MTPDQIADLVGREGYELRGPISRAENCRVVPEYPRQQAPNLAHQHGVIARRYSMTDNAQTLRAWREANPEKYAAQVERQRRDRERARAWRRAHGLGMGTQASGGRQRVQQIYASGQTAPDSWA